MLALESSLVDGQFVLFVNTMSVALNNILATGNIRSHVLIYENQTNALASALLSRIPSTIESTTFNVDTASQASQIEKPQILQMLKLRSAAGRMLVTSLIYGGSDSRKHAIFVNGFGFDVGIWHLSLFVHYPARIPLTLWMLSMCETASRAAAIFWNDGRPLACTGDPYMLKFIIPVYFGTDLSKLTAQQIFYDKHPSTDINYVIIVTSLVVVPNATSFKDFLKRTFGFNSFPFDEESMPEEFLGREIPEEFMYA